MKAGVATSVILHAIALGVGLFSLTAPPPMNVADVESMPVDIVPIEELTQIQKGDKKAKVNDKPAPKPTKRPDVVANAQNVGDNSVDTDKPPTPEPTQKPIQTASIPEPQPKPVDKPDPKPVEEVKKPAPAPVEQAVAKPEPKPEVKPVPVPEPQPKPAPIKPPEPKPEPVKVPEPAPQPKPVEQAKAIEQPKPPEPKPPEPKIDPVAETITADTTPVEKQEEVALPTSAPAPDAKPKPEQPTPPVKAAEATPPVKTAEATPDKKTEQKPTQQAGAKPQSTEKKQFDADQVAALLDKQKPSGGGAKRSTQTASLGGEKNTGGSKLSQTEIDALRGQVQKCWNIPAGAADGDSLKVSVKFKLDKSGEIEGSPEIVSGGGASGVERAAAEAARRAVQRCAPYNLPADKYDAWADVIVNFDPSEMF